MTMGIRAFTGVAFSATLPQLAELGPVAFRREVMDQAIMGFGISVASAATHYNHALKTMRAANPEAVKGLGRAEDKKGGRKPKAKDADGTVVVINAPVEAALEAGALPAEAALAITA